MAYAEEDGDWRFDFRVRDCANVEQLPRTRKKTSPVRLEAAMFNMLSWLSTSAAELPVLSSSPLPTSALMISIALEGQYPESESGQARMEERQHAYTEIQGQQDAQATGVD